jgi:RNA polymerase sigma-54 factor
MYMEQRPTVAPRHGQHQTITPKLIESTAILQLSAQELAQSVSMELRENPAFEANEATPCTQCGAPLQEGECPVCRSLGDQGSRGLDDWRDPEIGTSGVAEEDEMDPMLRVSAGLSLQESLLTAMGAVLSAEDMFIADTLVWSLNERGFMDVPIADLAATLGVPEGRILAVLEILQSQEPLGIGARDLAECLLLQLRWFREQGQPQPLAEAVVAHYLPDVAQRRFVEVGRALGTTSTHVRHAWEFIKKNLNPHPALAAIGGPIPRSAANARGDAALIRPDIIIRRTETGFEADVIERLRYRFEVSPVFRQVALMRDAPGVTDAQRLHIRQYVVRAQSFIGNIKQRWQTLRRITDALIEIQYEFLEHGVRALRPLTRSELALYVDLHEATISRATREKYVMLPDGRTIPFDDFFDGSLRVKDMMRELIAHEDPRHPLSDEDLAEHLAQQGVEVARRTVAKYREAMKILPSRLR